MKTVCGSSSGGSSSSRFRASLGVCMHFNGYVSVLVLARERIDCVRANGRRKQQLWQHMNEAIASERARASESENEGTQKLQRQRVS